MEGLRQAGEVLKTYDDTVGLLVSSLLKTFAFVASVWLGWLVVARLVPLLRRPSDLVLDVFANASGDAELDKVLVGLTQLAREQLAESLASIRRTILQYQEMLGDAATYIPRQPTALPSEAVDAHLSDLVASLKDVAPGEIKSIIPLLGVAFPARGTRITGVLQRQGDAPGALAITFRIVDLLGARPPSLYSVWESDSDTAATIPTDMAEPDDALQAVAAPPAGAVADPRVAAHCDIATRLFRLALISDALDTLRAALKIDGTDANATQLLESYTQALAIQQRRRAFQMAGQRSEDAGLVSDAVTSYALALSDTPVGEFAEALWRIALRQSQLLSVGDLASLKAASIDTNDPAGALMTLADEYCRVDVQLADVGEALLERCAADGSWIAKRKLRTVQTSTADQLVAVGEAFMSLADYASADKYFKAALAEQSDNGRAATALTRLGQQLPPQADKDALGLFTLGSTYEQIGAVAIAKTYYEQALQKQPTYADAQSGLERVLPQPRSLSERYEALLQPAAWSLAIELTVRDMLQQEKRVPQDQRPGFTAQILAFAAELNTSGAATFGEPFLSRAVTCAEQAADSCAGWYTPYVSLADACSERGDRTMREGGDKLAAKSDIRRAVRLYEKAYDMVDTATDYRFGVPPEIVGDPLMKGTNEVRERQRIALLHRIKLGRAIAWQRLGDQESLATARAIMEGLETGVIRGKRWDPCHPDEVPQVLLNHSEWHGRAFAISSDNTERIKAVRFVAYALVRYSNGDDVDLAYAYVQTSPELAALRVEVSTLVNRLPDYVLVQRDLSTLGGNAFRDRIEKILKDEGLPV